MEGPPEAGPLASGGGEQGAVHHQQPAPIAQNANSAKFMGALTNQAVAVTECYRRWRKPSPAAAGSTLTRCPNPYACS